MSNYSPSLQEFVTPVAICQLETDLGNILSIFQHLNCKMLAIPQGKLGWGIIYGSDLLSLITEVWLGDRIALTSHPRNITYQPYRQNMTYRSMPEVKSLIKPVMVYQAETALDEFLDHRRQRTLLTEEQTYLIVNQQGELAGRLDRDKIIQYLALKSSSVPLANQSAPKHKPDNQSSHQLPDYYSPYWVETLPPIQSPNSETILEKSVETSKSVNHQLLGTVSHELKSPLTGIVGLSSLLQAQKLGNLNQRQGRYVELIYRSGKKMMAVVDDLLQLTALMADPPQDSEAINLEFLCSQLYQEVLTRVRSLEGKPNFSATLVPPQLRIELDQEIAIPKVTQPSQRLTSQSEGLRDSFRVIANKLLLSSVLSHLMLEAIVVDETDEPDEPLDIQIKSLSGRTAIVITGQAMPSMDNPGLNLMIAKCLSELLEAKVTHTCSKSGFSTNCQFTLLLPPKVLLPKQMQSPKLEDVKVSNSSITGNNNKATNLTILCLYPELEVIDPQANHDHNSNFDLKSWSDNYEAQTDYQHRIIEADSLEQAHNLARIWQLDAIILNGHQIVQPSLYLRSLQESSYLATLPLITLDTRTTEAANQIEGLNVYPCLLPAQQRNIANLIQVIQIAIES
ncbi:MAG: histidine kinase dimerization/phospho-acceptor domain-containing protein [Waterburya sp.]